MSTPQPPDVEKNPGTGLTPANPLFRYITPGAASCLAPAEPKRANPSPLGLFSFASTTLLLSFINAGTRHLSAPNMVVGMCFAVGGLAQVLAGMCEFVVGNTFGFTAFVSYGTFWMSLGLIFWPSSGILAAYADDEGALNSALGLFMIVWFTFTLIMLIGAIRLNVMLVTLFSSLSLSFLLLSIGHFLQSSATIKAAGYFGAITAFIAYYGAAWGLYGAEGVPFALPNPSLKRD